MTTSLSQTTKLTFNNCIQKDTHDNVIKWKHLPRYCPFVRGTHRSPVYFPGHNGQWRGALMFSLMCAWTKSWANTLDAGESRRHGAHCDATVMWNRNGNVTIFTPRFGVHIQPRLGNVYCTETEMSLIWHFRHRHCHWKLSRFDDILVTGCIGIVKFKEISGAANEEYVTKMTTFPIILVYHIKLCTILTDVIPIFDSHFNKNWKANFGS